MARTLTILFVCLMSPLTWAAPPRTSIRGAPMLRKTGLERTEQRLRIALHKGVVRPTWHLMRGTRTALQGVTLVAATGAGVALTYIVTVGFALALGGERVPLDVEAMATLAGGTILGGGAHLTAGALSRTRGVSWLDQISERKHGLAVRADAIINAGPTAGAAALQLAQLAVLIDKAGKQDQRLSTYAATKLRLQLKLRIKSIARAITKAELSAAVGDLDSPGAALRAELTRLETLARGTALKVRGTLFAKPSLRQLLD